MTALWGQSESHWNLLIMTLSARSQDTAITCEYLFFHCQITTKQIMPEERQAKRLRRGLWSEVDVEEECWV